MPAEESQQEQRSTEEVILLELGRVVDPLEEAVQDGPDGVLDLLDRMGIGELLLDTELEKIVAQIQDSIGDPLNTLRTNILEPIRKGEELSFADINYKEVAGAIGSIFQGVRDLKQLNFQQVDPVTVGDRFVDFLLVTYLHDHHRATHNALAMTGVVTEGHPPEVDFTVIGDLFTDPNAAMTEALDWGTQSFSGFLVTYYVHEILWRFQLPATLADPPVEAVSELAGFDVSGMDLESEVRIPVLSAFEENSSVNLGVRIVPTPGKEGTALPGLAIVPYGAAQTDQAFDLGNGWTFNVRMSVDQADWGLLARPNLDDGSLEADLVGNAAPTFDSEAEIAYEGEGADEETTLLGTPDASRLAVKYAGLTATVAFDDGELTIKVALPARGTIGVHPSDFDGFLSKVMPPDGIFYDFDVTVGWSSQTGLFFDRGGTLEVSLPQNTSLGPLSMKEIWLAAGQPKEGSAAGGSSGSAGGSGGSSGGSGVDASASGSASGDVSVEEGEIHIAGAASGTVKLGPVSATVKRIGVEADVSFPEDGGNLGPVDLELGFKPPEGVGISIDAGAVSGGGYLEFDYENERYAGVLQIKAGSLTINAVGLLTTKLPGGKDGFSLLLIISGEFSPVQLGLGFTLNGVGGLIGINRSVKADPLGKAVRTGSMDSILFPEDPVANAQRIISDLRAIFPPTDGVHAVGPMAKLGWGTPTLITADIGVILEIPTWKIVLLGRLSAVLPDEEAALIELNLAVAGILDPPNKRVAIDASLYDSRVVMWTVSGDMALRSNWGDDPRFVLSVGGFNPRFDPPEDFPQLDRVKASMGAPGGNPRIEYTGYFAVTSNTVQAGAGVYAVAKAGPAKAEGKLAFDALIQFDPFKFIVDFLASLKVTIKGKGLTIKVDGTLSGPSPFRIKGKIHIEILFITITASIDVRIGPSKSQEELPRARIMPKLTEELSKPANWTAQLPETGPSLVTVREVEAGENEVRAHPLGRIGVRQTVVPLDFAIEKFGNARPSGYTKFTIDGVTVGGESTLDLGAKTTEQFAPAQYTELSDSEKIDSPAFQAQTAGRQMAHEGIYCGYGEGKRAANTRTTTMGYECTVVDKTKGNWGTPLAKLGRFRSEHLDAISGIPPAYSDALAEVGAVARSPARINGGERFRLTDVERERLHAQAGGLASRIDLSDQLDEGTTTPTTETVVRGGSDPDEGGLASSVSVGESGYVIASARDKRKVDVPTADGEMSKAGAQRALSAFKETHPNVASQLRVVQASKARDVGGEQTAEFDGIAAPDGGDLR